MLRSTQQIMQTMGLGIFFGILITFLTYNPSEKSLYHFFAGSGDKFGARMVLLIIVIAVVHGAMLVASWKAFGFFGKIAVIAIISASLYLFLEEGWLTPDGGIGLQWFGLCAYGVFVGVGLVWAKVRRRVTGQVSTDEMMDLGDSGDDD